MQHRDRESPTPPRVGHTYGREMDLTIATHPVPDRVVVIGAGMVGLSTAWFLQEHGVQVTVLDRTGVAAGSSWGNAGWLTPGVATPLPEPAVLRYGLRAALSPSSRSTCRRVSSRHSCGSSPASSVIRR